MKKYRIIFWVVTAVFVLGIIALYLNPLVEDTGDVYTRYGIGGRYTQRGIIEGTREATLIGDIFIIAVCVILVAAAAFGLGYFLYKRIRWIVFRIRDEKDPKDLGADTDEIYYNRGYSNKAMMERQIELHSVFPYANKEKKSDKGSE